MPNLRIPTPSAYWEDAAGPNMDFKSWFALFESWITLQDMDRETPLGNREKNNMLLLLLGAEGMKTFKSNPAMVTVHTASFESFAAAVTDTFSVPVNQVRARFDFFNRRQSSSETCAEYLAALRTLASDCGFCDEKCVKQHLATMLVVGCANKASQEKLLMEKDVNFDKFLEVLKTDESAREAASHLQAATSKAATADLNAISKYNRSGRERFKQKEPARYKSSAEYGRKPQTGYTKSCTYCGGKHPPDRSKCPALKAKCYKCNNQGHFAKVCRTRNRTAKAISLSRSPSPAGLKGHNYGIGCLKVQSTTSSAVSKEKFKCSVSITHAGKSRELVAEVDSGSDISTVPYSFYHEHFSEIAVKPLPTDTRITAYDKRQIKGVRGTLPLEMEFKGRFCRLEVYIMPDSYKPVLGKDAIKGLELYLNPKTFEVSVLDSKIQPDKYLDRYPNLLKPGAGQYPDYEHVIKVTEDVEPKVTRLRTVPLARRAAVRKEIQTMVDLGIWEPCEKSEWQHGMVTVPKGDGSVRITTDLTPLNPFVIPSRHPLPNIKDTFLKLRGATVFSKLDLSKAYYTIAIAPESRPLTATITDMGVFQYKCLPMGLKDSAAVFQKCVAETLEDINGCLNYIDDILIYGTDRKTHDESLLKALAALDAKKFQLNADKCVFAQPSVTFLGHVVSEKGVHPHPRRIQPIKDGPPPTDVKAVPRFLGFMRYFQDYIPGLATIAEPLHRLTRKDVKFEWDAICKKAFKTLVAMLSEKLLVGIFDPNAPTFVSTDASHAGLGASLSQMQNGKEVYIAFASRTLRPHERNYTANEAEALACLWACEYWEKFLIGRPFVLRTDHSALQTMLTKHQNARTASKFSRWRERLAAVEYTVEYRKGTDNIVADTLSRMPLTVGDCEYDRKWPLSIEAVTLESGLTLERLKRHTAADRFCSKIMHYIKARRWPCKEKLPSNLKPFYALRHDFVSANGLLVRSDERIIVPCSLRRELLDMAHEGHPGIVRMKRKVKETYWWPGLSNDVELHVKYCVPCQRSAKSVAPADVSNRGLPATGRPWQLVSIDIAGAYAVAPHHERFILVLMDHCSGFPEYKVMGTITSTAIIHWLEEIFARYGYPDELLSDNGKQFVSDEFAAYLQVKGIRHRRAAVYNPQSNSKVECFNRYIKHGVQTFSKGSWKLQLAQLVRCFRATAPGSEETSPAEKLDGWPMRLAFQPAKSTPKKPHEDQPERKTSPSPQHHFPSLRSRGPFQRGQWVLVKRPAAQVLKGQSPWSRPIRVEAVLGSHTYRLADGQTWNTRRLRSFHRHPSEEDDVRGAGQPDAMPRRSERRRQPPRRYSPSPRKQ